MSRPNKQQKVIRNIEEAILTRVHNPGDRLPPEKDLMERYGVGRGTLWEALKALEQQGLIELRRGANGGAYVKEMDPEYASRTLSMLIRHQQVPAEYILEFREVLEEKTAVFAAETKGMYTILSGPAAGVLGAGRVGKLAGFPNVITLDMGGTSMEIPPTGKRPKSRMMWKKAIFPNKRPQAITGSRPRDKRQPSGGQVCLSGLMTILYKYPMRADEP